ncbi:hypothetical protein C7B62_20320 [Pleurocapsa sp. CCALA 161]|uniref:DUF1254 domain-containing protein n=1 Tax=Pleurocapsa sp. CCALA 161 TaxID=2107688 RepID=UPI000D04E02A|nr:DUF1214 domain-containing protein [Pleurocapsa sp. CCALA 161]PSB07302.1 hypothetical protein C7B62_20320 [Pleurocapsa sp. CCALA 161]
MKHRKITEEAYVFGLPLVEHSKLFAQALRSDSSKFTGTNVFQHIRQLATSADNDVVTLNNDTLYSGAILDVRVEPVIITIPPMENRYFSIQFVDITTDNLSIVSTRTTGSGSKVLLVAGPDCDSHSSKNLPVTTSIRSSSRLIFALARMGVDDDTNFKVANALQDQMHIIRLSTYLGIESSPPPELQWPPFYNPKKDDSLKFFEYMNYMMQWYEFGERERSLLKRFAKIGVKPGAPFDVSSLSEEASEVMKTGIRDGKTRIKSLLKAEEKRVKGWTKPDPHIGTYGQNYELRARVAWAYLYALSPKEAIYFQTQTDSNSQRLDGSKANYVLSFAKDHFPPVKFFWSLTMYDANSLLLVENSLKRYALGSRSKFLKYNKDGGLTLHLQKPTPLDAEVSNWLPAPDGYFYIVLRLFGPSEDAIEGNYTPPAVTRIEKRH